MRSARGEPNHEGSGSVVRKGMVALSIRAGMPKRHSYAPCVNDANPTERAVELHVGVTTDHELGSHSFEHFQQTILACQASETFRLASRRPWQNRTRPTPSTSRRHRANALWSNPRADSPSVRQAASRSVTCQ